MCASSPRRAASGLRWWQTARRPSASSRRCCCSRPRRRPELRPRRRATSGRSACSTSGCASGTTPSSELRWCRSAWGRRLARPPSDRRTRTSRGASACARPCGETSAWDSTRASGPWARPSAPSSGGCWTPTRSRGGPPTLRGGRPTSWCRRRESRSLPCAIPPDCPTRGPRMRARLRPRPRMACSSRMAMLGSRVRVAPSRLPTAPQVVRPRSEPRDPFSPPGRRGAPVA
mmetsp:Transcript_10069/g.27682  ORF Transcript_10069/g.27682 Transcript_10069/m.27682 type:complete len:231 (+) Transcript_10069:490-1182(+)